MDDMIMPPPNYIKGSGGAFDVLKKLGAAAQKLENADGSEPREELRALENMLLCIDMQLDVTNVQDDAAAAKLLTAVRVSVKNLIAAIHDFRAYAERNGVQREEACVGICGSDDELVQKSCCVLDVLKERRSDSRDVVTGFLAQADKLEIMLRRAVMDASGDEARYVTIGERSGRAGGVTSAGPPEAETKIERRSKSNGLSVDGVLYVTIGERAPVTGNNLSVGGRGRERQADDKASVWLVSDEEQAKAYFLTSPKPTMLNFFAVGVFLFAFIFMLWALFV